ncbi:unnamed protein product [Eruca vesicaria subsp. sativa]|uniref:Uncharacterized protein n=1 Tax=Eruca vesicaria subsp. sativa TaxID=29727 RepID=A0ABC8LWN1_ERUVS|nr:unnamed protein product [Eruca vesicaria subsp. sativa]
MLVLCCFKDRSQTQSTFKLLRSVVVLVDVLQAVKRAFVPVILDVGGMDTPILNELLDSVDVLSSNETELSRLDRMHTETFQHFSQAVAKCHKLVCKSSLIKHILG